MDVDHASWVEFTLIHSGRSFDYTAHRPEAMKTGGGQVCPGRCYALRTDRIGDAEVARFISATGKPSPAVGVIETDSL